MTTIEHAQTAVRLPPRSSHSRPGQQWLRRIPRLLTGAALLAVATLLIVVQEQVRHLEALAMAAVFSPFAGGRTTATHDIFLVPGPDGWLGLRITVECTTVVLLVPVLVLSALLVMLPKGIPWRRWALSAILGVTLMCVINGVRLAMIASASVHFGMVGYEWTHLVFGSVFALIGGVLTLIVMLRLVSTKRRRRDSH